MKGPGKEANATRVISQPQMLDKSGNSIVSGWLQTGWRDCLEEKNLPILSKVHECCPDLPV